MSHILTDPASIGSSLRLDRSMKLIAFFKGWWRPLPLWLKGATLIAAYPAWFLLLYCILTGQARNPLTVVAFGIYLIVALLHLAYNACD